MSNFMKIRPAGAELFHADGKADRHNEANSRFSQILRTRLRKGILKAYFSLTLHEFLSLNYITSLMQA